MRKSGNFVLLLVGVLALLALVLVLFSDFITLPLGGYADQRFALAILFGLLTFSVIISYARRWPVDLHTALRAGLPTFLLCLVYMLLSFPYRNQPYVWVEPGMYGFFFVSTFATGAMLSWMLSGVFFSQYFLTIIAVFCAFYGLSSVNVYLFAIIDGVTDLIDFIPWGFVNIRYWSHIATWCLPLMPLAVLVGPLKDNRLWHGFVLLGAGLWWWILLLTTGRGSMLGVFFSMMLVVCLFGRLALPWLRVFSKYLLSGIVIWVVLSVIIPSFMSEEVQVRSIKTDSSGRMPLFMEAWTMSLQNFPFGMGPQSWLSHEIITDAYSNSKKFGHPHNMYLLWAAEYGWLLVVTLGLLVAQAVHYFWQKRREIIATQSHHQALLLVGYTASVSAALFHAGVSAVFMAPGSMLVGTFVLTAFWSLIVPSGNLSGENQKSGKIPSRARRVVLTGALGALVIIIWLEWVKGVKVYYQDMRQDEVHYHEEHAEGILPRFWFHGNYPRAPEQD